MHGPTSLNDPPPPSAVTALPAGGTIDFEITGNKGFTSMGRGLWVKPGTLLFIYYLYIHLFVYLFCIRCYTSMGT
jgi:hypothetical protein